MVTGALYFCVCREKNWYNVSSPESCGSNDFEARIQDMQIHLNVYLWIRILFISKVALDENSNTHLPPRISISVTYDVISTYYHEIYLMFSKTRSWKKLDYRHTKYSIYDILAVEL